MLGNRATSLLVLKTNIEIDRRIALSIDMKQIVLWILIGFVEISLSYLARVSSKTERYTLKDIQDGFAS